MPCDLAVSIAKCQIALDSLALLLDRDQTIDALRVLAAHHQAVIQVSRSSQDEIVVTVGWQTVTVRGNQITVRGDGPITPKDVRELLEAIGGRVMDQRIAATLREFGAVQTDHHEVDGVGRVTQFRLTT